MTLRIIVGLAALGALLAAPRQGNAQGPDYLRDPHEISYRNELPRTRMLSFNTRELALRQDIRNSTYIEWLDGAWKVRRFAQPAEIDPSLTAPATDASGWGDAAIPEQGIQPGAAAVYRREFKMPMKWIDREVFVHVGAVSRAYYLYINGKLAGYHEDSRTGIDYDITSFVVEGKNHLAIVAYADPVSATLENQVATRGTAILQDVYILSQPKVRMRDYVLDARFEPEGTGGLFNFGVIVKTHLLNAKEVTVHYELMASDSTIVASGRRDARFDMRGEDTVRFVANIPNVQAWSHENPKLYTVILRLQHEGRFTEYMAYRIGFRNVRFDDRGLHINGHPVDIRAVDIEPAGTEEALRAQLSGLKKAGVNMVRTVNFPQNDAFYALCDEYGIYVCNSANIDTHLSGPSRAKDGNPANDPQWERAYTDRVMNMYYTSRNHPSVVAFSLGKNGGNGYNTYEAYLKLKAAEPLCPVIYDAGAEWNTDIVIGAPQGRNAVDSRSALRFAGTAAEAAAAPATGTAERIGITEKNIDRGEFQLENRHSVANLNSFDIRYRINERSKIVASGPLATNIAPGGTGTVVVPLEGLKPGSYTVTISVSRLAGMGTAGSQEMLAEKIFPLTVAKPGK